MTFKTLQEQEREAYITGHVFMADLLAKAIDAEAEIDDLRAEVELLESDLAGETELRKELQAELDAK